MNPTNPTIDKLRKILTQLPAYSEDILTTDEVMLLWPELREAQQAIIALIDDNYVSKSTHHKKINSAYHKGLKEGQLKIDEAVVAGRIDEINKAAQALDNNRFKERIVKVHFDYLNDRIATLTKENGEE